jgi:hypothetical protein
VEFDNVEIMEGKCFLHILLLAVVAVLLISPVRIRDVSNTNLVGEAHIETGLLNSIEEFPVFSEALQRFGPAAYRGPNGTCPREEELQREIASRVGWGPVL